jgi:predicted signal transduction protein with EAL and GGDEF domain
VLTAASVPVAAVFVASAPGDFWVLTALALAADVRPVPLPPSARRSTTFVVSVSFCFVILLLYGTAPAIVVQVAAVAVAARRLHLNRRSWAFLSARLACSFAAAGAVAGLLGMSAEEIRRSLSPAGTAGLVLIGFVLLAVSLTINVVAASVSGATVGEVVTQLRFDLLARGSMLILGVVIATTPTVWSLLLFFIPIVGWSQLARLLADQERRLEHDPVTGLLSPYGLEVAMLNLPRHYPLDGDWFVMVLVRLRGMAYVGRTFGSDAVEHMQAAVAIRLRKVARAKDLICRVSESHFVILRSDLSGDGIDDDARRVVEVLSAPVELEEGIPFRLDPVAGVAVAPHHGQDLAQLITHAEAALFDAPARPDVVSVYTPQAPSSVDDRLALLRRLSAAVNDPRRASEIAVLYQPQVGIATGRSDSVEALLRWHDRELGIVPTDELMRVVEPTGVMQQVTRHVLDRVVAQLAEWNESGLHLRAAVNVSVLDLCTDDFAAQVDDTLRRHGVAPDRLNVEITERGVVDDMLLLDEGAERVARLGVGLSLDDFGTGYASLRQLRRMPLTEVKIDRLYVSRIAQSRPDRAVVTAIHDVVKVLGLRVVAEGIEDEATVRILAAFDGMIGQGWYYARPMPAQELVAWLRDRSR